MEATRRPLPYGSDETTPAIWERRDDHCRMEATRRPLLYGSDETTPAVWKRRDDLCRMGGTRRPLPYGSDDIHPLLLCCLSFALYPDFCVVIAMVLYTLIRLILITLKITVIWLTYDDSSIDMYN